MLENPMVSGEGFPNEEEYTPTGTDSLTGDTLFEEFEVVEFDDWNGTTAKFIDKDNLIKWLIQEDYVVIKG